MLQLRSDLFVYSPLPWTYQPSSANLERLKRGSQETGATKGEKGDCTLSGPSLCKPASPLAFPFSLQASLPGGESGAILNIQGIEIVAVRIGVLSAGGCMECGEEVFYRAPSFCQVMLLEWSVPTSSAPEAIAFL